MNSFEKLSYLIILLVHIRIHCVLSVVQKTCGKHQFQCDNGKCILLQRECDGRLDCIDLSDELHCTNEPEPKCTKEFFQCSDGYCIHYFEHCDNYTHCEDGSDERNCVPPPCTETREFECLKNKQCIPRTKLCDGQIDCEDGSDERTCFDDRKHCRNLDFPCEKDKICLPRAWLCDGDDDCDDGSDEMHCPFISFHSASTTVIPATTEQTCPDNYCMHGADCIVVEGEYICNCSPSFTGEKCERSISAELEFHDLGLVIGISMTLIIIFIIMALMLFCYFKRRSERHSTALRGKTESQMPIASYSKE
ncbi:low-density lipoprotein receptor-related protein 8-like isoform X1 [Argiope bruennichi]|uniref:low-density lipoprotein receptor-related protein 8-like isoform X1 n=1 Tax=Argiope bruennichi TaxID=94029 RepID=UPI0024959AE9|nr:low-density lipoprotein receptor-related protein 8-like isoform X1 [Argiope bruennichi]